jgi:hypothetical protein
MEAAGTSREEASDCGAETTPTGEQPVRWEVVAVTLGPAQAAIVRGRLESEGIPTQARGEAAGAVIGLTVGKLGEVKVLVPEHLFERAVEILDRPVSEEDADAWQETSDADDW